MGFHRTLEGKRVNSQYYMLTKQGHVYRDYKKPVAIYFYRAVKIPKRFFHHYRAIFSNKNNVMYKHDFGDILSLFRWNNVHVNFYIFKKSFDE